MPDDRSPLFVAMCGIPFAGKTSLAQEIAARGGMALLGVDAAVRDGEIDIGADGLRGFGWARAIASTFREARARLEAGESVVFDHANHTRLARDRCRRLAAASGARFAGVWVATDVETARARQMANRERPARPDVPDASFRQIVTEVEPPTAAPDVIRWQPGMEIDALLREMRSASAHDL